MSTHHVPRLVAALLLALTVAACGSNNSTAAIPTTTTTPTTTATTTESFKGTLTINGAASTFYTTLSAGTVTATLKSLDPDSTVTVGLALGNWTGSACSIALANDAALLGNVITGTVSGVTSICVRVYDVGKLTASTNYSVDITHP